MSYHERVYTSSDAIELMCSTAELAQITLVASKLVPVTPPRPIEPWYAIQGDHGNTIYVHPENQRRVKLWLESLPQPSELYPLAYCDVCCEWY